MKQMLILVVVIATGVMLAPCLRGAEQPPRQTLRLLDQGPRPGSLLIREVARQAVLIAGRDQLGLATRDQALREPITGMLGSDAIAPLDVHVSFKPPDSVHFELVEPSTAGNGERSLWRTTFKLGKDAAHSPVTAFATAIVPHIHTDLAGALRKAGFIDARSAATRSASAPPDQDRASESGQANQPGADLESQVRTLTMFAQFQVLRAVHERVRIEGSSSQSAGLLVRAYANLGQLTAFQWHASSKVFFARALLHAEQTVQNHPKDPIALWHRAYARTLAGLHAAALSDLKAADELAKHAHVEAPKWVALLSPACRFDVPALFHLAQSDPDLAPLGMYLSFLAVENSGSIATVMSMAKAALMVNPQCMRLLDGMCAVAGVSYLHDLTLRFPESFKQSLAQNLPEIAGLPPAVKAVLAGAQWNLPKTRAELVTTLVAAANDPSNPDTGEPSWAVLGTMIQDTYVVHVQRRINFMSNQWSVGEDETRAFGEAAMELIGDAPDAPIIRSYGYRYPVSDCLARLKGYAPQDLGIGFSTVISHHLGVGNDAVAKQYSNPLFEQMRQHNFDTAGDLEVFAAWYWNDSFQSKQALSYLRRIIGPLEAVSPYDPRVVAFRIRHEWDKHADQAPRWEKEYAGHPLVTENLAVQYEKLKRFADAERLFQLYVEVCPDRWGYKKLAQTQLDQGDEAQWLGTLQYYLNHVEDYGLDHANIQDYIARHYMDEGKCEKALPFADAAAEDSGAAWAMTTASRVHEKLGQWNKAELWIRSDSERYEGDAAEWYVFCRRTGHGDVAAARALAADYLRKSRGTSLGSYCTRGLLEMLNNENRLAEREFLDAMRKHDDIWCGLQAALLCEIARDSAGRDAVLQECAERVATRRAKNPKYKPSKAAKLAMRIKEHFDNTPSAPMDPAVFDRLLQGEENPVVATNIAFLAGSFLARDAAPAQSDRFFRKCVQLDERGKYQWTMAWIALRERGVDPAQPAPIASSQPTTRRTLGQY